MPTDSVIVENLNSMADGPILYSDADLNEEFSERLTLKCMDSDTDSESNRSPDFLDNGLIYERREEGSASTSPEAPTPSAESEIGSSAPLSPTDSGIGSPACLTSTGSETVSQAHQTSPGSEIGNLVHLISPGSGISSQTHLTFPVSLIRFSAGLPPAGSVIGFQAGLPPTSSGLPPTGSGLPATSSGLPPIGPVIRVQAGLPPTSSGLPATSSGLPPIGPVIRVQAGLPPTGSGLPATSSGLPPTGPVIRVQAGLPPTGSGLPPTGSDLPPTGSDLPPTGSDLPPTGSVYQFRAGLTTPYSRICSSRRARLPPPGTGRIVLSNGLPSAHSGIAPPAHLSAGYTGINSPGYWSANQIKPNLTAESRFFTPGFVACIPGAPGHSIRKFSPPIAGNYPMTGNAMEPEEDNDSRHYSDMESMAVGETALDLSTGNKADSSSNSNRAPVSVQNPSNELTSPANCQTPEVPHTTPPATGFYPVISAPLDVPTNFMPRKANWQVTTLPPSPPPRQLPTYSVLEEPVQQRLSPTAEAYPMPDNNAQAFPMLDSSAEEPQNMNDPEVMGNSVENLGLAGGRPLNSFRDAALVGYGGQLGPNGIGIFRPSSLSCLPNPFDASHGSPSFSLATANVFNRKRRHEQRERDRKDKDVTKSCALPALSAPTVICAQASSNSEEGNEDPEAKKPKTIPEEKKDEAYWERRRKNNEAAKRSRDARRQKEEEIALRATYLEQENLKLRAEIAVLKNETAKLHCLLLNRPMHRL